MRAVFVFGMEAGKRLFCRSATSCSRYIDRVAGWLSRFETPVPSTTQENQTHVGAPFFEGDARSDTHDGIAGPINAFPMMGWIDSADIAAPMPTSLDPNAPRKLPGVEGGPLDNAAAKRIASKGDAEALLKAKDDPTGAKAGHAVELLLQIPADERGKAIDALDDAAFRALLDRVPSEQREHYMGLLAGTKRADRKLHLWKEAHVSRARNDATRQKGDIGADEPDVEQKLGGVDVDESPAKRETATKEWHAKHDETDNSQHAFDVRGAKRTVEQKGNLARHERRVERATHTRDEVRDEVGDLYGADGTVPTLAEVDAVIARKEKEYALEQKSGIDFTNEMRGPNERKWELDELDSVELTLDRLPHDHTGRLDGFKELRRAGALQGRTSVGGATTANKQLMEIFDNGATEFEEDGTPREAFSHGGQKREGVSDAFDKQHSDRIGILEWALTHEIGHDVAARNPNAFNAFKKAAGYSEVTRDEMLADGMTEDEIKAIDPSNPGSGGSNPGHQRRYSARPGGKFEGVDHTGLPYSSPDLSPNKLDDRNDSKANSWRYSAESADEHFADVYAKAVHKPGQLYDDLVAQPAAAAKLARRHVAELLAQINATPETPANADKLARLQAALDKSTADMETKQRAVEQRGGQFEVMREQVFHGDKAANEARVRLGLAGVDDKRLTHFDAEAAQLSTPEQILMLEERYRR